MEFPRDLWGEIMSYFHSAYRKPLHYNCLLENTDFYFTREKNKKMSFLLPSQKSLFDLQMKKVYDSFYMKIILTARNTTLKKNKSSICLKRRKAPLNIVNDFKQIFEEYKNENLQFLTNVNYI